MIKLARYIKTHADTFYKHYGDAYYGVMILEFDNEYEAHIWGKNELGKQIAIQGEMETFLKNKQTNDALLTPPAQQYRVTRAYNIGNKIEVRVEIFVNPFAGLE